MAKVLIIDDSPIMVKSIQRILETQGFEVIGNAANGRIGIEMIEKHNPDVITLDVTMPEMTGLEMAKYFLDNKPEVLSKIIMISAMDDDELLKEATENGVRNFSDKPINKDNLINIINKILSDKV